MSWGFALTCVIVAAYRATQICRAPSVAHPEIGALDRMQSAGRQQRADVMSVPNAYDFADIKAAVRRLSQSDPAMPIEDIVRSIYEDLYEGEPCPPALIDAVKQALHETDINGQDAGVG